MNFIKRFKGILITIGILAIFLFISFYLPEQANIETDGQINEQISKSAGVSVLVETAEPTMKEPVETDKPLKLEEKETLAPTPTHVATIETKEVLEPLPTPVAPFETKDPIDAQDEKNTLFCTFTVRCDTVLNNLEKLSPEKIELIPESGIILSETELEFSEGDTVFDVLEKVLKKHKIHFEFSKVSMYDSSYIEGIGNLYEFDAGNLSGWLYRVNGIVPSVGCSQYELKNEDKVEILYTCNMGRDI